MNLINSKKTSTSKTETSIHSDTFNNYFTNIALDLENKLPIARLNPVKLVSNAFNNQSSMFLTPVEDAEVHSIIGNMSNSTAEDVWGISNHLLKSLRGGLVQPLTLKMFSNWTISREINGIKSDSYTQKKGNPMRWITIDQ